MFQYDVCRFNYIRMMLYGVYVVNWGHDEGGKSGQGWNCCALPGDSVITTRRHR